MRLVPADIGLNSSRYPFKGLGKLGSVSGCRVRQFAPSFRGPMRVPSGKVLGYCLINPDPREDPKSRSLYRGFP